MRKGFTLVELIAVVVILGIILVIAVPQITDVINNAKVNAVIINEEMLVSATKNYLVSNNEKLPNEIGSTKEVTLVELQTEELIQPIKSPFINDNCNGYVLITKIDETNYDYTPHLNCVDPERGSAAADGLVLHYKFDDFQEPTENGIISPDFYNNIGGYGGVNYERIEDEESFTGYTLKIEHYNVSNSAARIRFNVKDGYVTGLKAMSVYAKAEGNFIGRELQTYTGENWYTFNGGTLENYYKKFWLVAPVGTISYGPFTVSVRTIDNGIFYVHSPQIEGKEYLTPFVNEVREGIVKDYSFNSNHSNLDLITTPRWAFDTILGRSVYQFNGVNNFISISDNFSINHFDEMTLMTWVKAEGYSEFIELLFHKSTSASTSGPSSSYSFFLENTSEYIGLRVGYEDGTHVSINSYNAYNYIKNNPGWHHFAMIWEGPNKDLMLYINGERVAISSTPNKDMRQNSSPLTLGGSIYNSRFFEGRMSDVRIYNRTVTESEIRRLYELGKKRGG